MDNITIILGTIIIATGISLVFHFLYKKKKTKEDSHYDSDLTKFYKAVDLKDIKGINHFGKLVIWNTNLKYTDLELIASKLRVLVKEYPELKKLENIAFNKKLGYDVPYTRKY